MTRRLALLLVCLVSLCACRPDDIHPGKVDIGFLQAMSLHHEQAILLAQIARERGFGGAAGAVAKSVEGAQLIELGQMKGWLQLWRQSLLPGPSLMGWMKPEGEDAEAIREFLAMCRTGGGMAGAVTAQQFDTLRNTQPDAAIALFLRLMLRHHQGGLPMARYAATHAETAVVRQFARQIVIEQSTEVRQLSTLLAASP
jgi:uncharacterized protein (DUF305 family)